MKHKKEMSDDSIIEVKMEVMTHEIAKYSPDDGKVPPSQRVVHIPIRDRLYTQVTQ